MVESLQEWVRNAQTSIFPQGSLSARFARGVFWSLVGTAIAQVLSLASSVVVARLLGRVGFGELGMINSTVGMFGVFAGLGLGLTATKHVAEYRVSDPDRAGKILGLSELVAVMSGGIVSLLLFTFAPLLAERTLNAPHLVNELRLGCGLLFLNALNGAQTGALAGFEAFKTIAQVNLVRGLFNFPVMIAGVWFFGLPGAVGAMVVVAAAGWLINHLALRRECERANITVTYRGARSEWRVLGKFSFPAFISSAMAGPILWLVNTILANQPGGYGELGLVNAANQWKTIVIFLPSTVANVALPALSAVFGDHERSSETNRSIEILNAMNQVVLWPVSIFLMFMAASMIDLYGTGFEQGRQIFVFLIGGTAIGFVGNTIGTLIVSRGMMWFGALQNLTWGVVILLVTYIGAQTYGALALAIGTALAYFLILNWSTIYMHHQGELPTTFAHRVMAGGMMMLVLMVIAAIIPKELAALVAVPLGLASIPVSLHLFASRDVTTAFRMGVASFNPKLKKEI